MDETDDRILFIILQSLIQELDAERERRWKAEQAARKMVDAIKEMQLKGLLAGLGSKPCCSKYR